MKNGNNGCMGMGFSIAMAFVMAVMVMFGARPSGYPGGRNTPNPPESGGGCAWMFIMPALLGAGLLLSQVVA